VSFAMIEIVLLLVILIALVRIARALAACCALLRAISFTNDNGGGTEIVPRRDKGSDNDNHTRHHRHDLAGQPGLFDHRRHARAE
jgi:hypothetical protein